MQWIHRHLPTISIAYCLRGRQPACSCQNTADRSTCSQTMHVCDIGLSSIGCFTLRHASQCRQLFLIGGALAGSGIGYRFISAQHTVLCRLHIRKENWMKLSMNSEMQPPKMHASLAENVLFPACTRQGANRGRTLGGQTWIPPSAYEKRVCPSGSCHGPECIHWLPRARARWMLNSRLHGLSGIDGIGSQPSNVGGGGVAYWLWLVSSRWGVATVLTPSRVQLRYRLWELLNPLCRRAVHHEARSLTGAFSHWRMDSFNRLRSARVLRVRDERGCTWPWQTAIPLIVHVDCTTAHPRNPKPLIPSRQVFRGSERHGDLLLKGMPPPIERLCCWRFRSPCVAIVCGCGLPIPLQLHIQAAPRPSHGPISLLIIATVRRRRYDLLQWLFPIRQFIIIVVLIGVACRTTETGSGLACASDGISRKMA